MKKEIGFLVLGMLLFFGSVQAYALTRVHSIHVDFDNHTAQIKTFDYVINADGNSVDTGASADISINNPAFDEIITTLAQQNALDLDVLLNVITNQN